MDTVRLARDLGDVSGLLPAGVDRLRDIPHALMLSIKAALIFLSFEEMPSEDQPPRSIWTNNELLSAHLDEVRRKYKQGDDDDSGPEKRNHDARRMLIAG